MHRIITNRTSDEPVFVVPEVVQANLSFNNISNSWLDSINEMYTIDDPEGFWSGVRMYSTTSEISWLPYMQFGVDAISNSVFLWDSSNPDPSFTEYKTLGWTGVTGVQEVRWSPNNPPRIVISMGPAEEQGRINLTRYSTGRNGTFLSYRYYSNSNPLLQRNMLIRCLNDGSISICMRSQSTAVIRYFVCNSLGAVTSGGTIAKAIPNRPLIISNAVRHNGKSVYWDDGGTPGIIKIRDWKLSRNLGSVHSISSDGEWSMGIAVPQFDCTYIRKGCQPVCHGPFVI